MIPIDDEEYYRYPALSSKDYDCIENIVVEMYVENDIYSFPINPFEIVSANGYDLHPFSKTGKEVYDSLIMNGLVGANIAKPNGDNLIYFDDDNILTRQRFTIMHEVGHIKLGHRQESELADKAANHFASYSLAPTPLIHVYKCISYKDIAKRFNVSQECAIVALKRYDSWLERGGLYKEHEIKLLRHFGVKI